MPSGCLAFGDQGVYQAKPAQPLFANCDAQRSHLAVKMAAFKPQQLRGVADVVARFFNLLENIFALIGVAGLLESREVLGGT